MCRELICIGTLLSLVVGIPYAKGDISDELIGYWNCDEGTISGTVVADSSGKENHGIAIGGPTPVPGKVGTGALALGPGIWIAIDSVADDVQGAEDITANGWVRTATDPSENVYWFGAHTAAKSNIFMFAIAASTAQGRAGIYDGGTGAIELYSKDPVNDNQWHMLTYIKSGSEGTLYVDGVVQGTHTVRYPPFSSDNLWSIGQEWDAGGPSQFFHDAGQIDEVAIWRRALTAAEIVRIYDAGTGMPLLRRPVASDPSPADESMDVPRDVSISWTPGIYADKHDVYLGTNFTDVNDASRTNPRGVLAGQGQIAATYDPARLDFGQTYYWRVDEVNAPPGSTIYRGEVWSFAVEPFAYAIEHITATASSSNTPDEGPANTTNGSGLDAKDLHSALNPDMWLSGITGPQPTWIQYEFDRVYKLHQMWVWNHNSLLELSFGLGVKSATIEHSVDGTNWTTVGTTHEFARGLGAAGYAPNTTVDLGGAAARYVKITANSNWGGFVNQYGLSEVRFFSIPVFAREPSPVPGATDVSVEATLNWRAGREAAKHNVYLGMDEQAVRDGTAPVVTVTSPSYTSSLDLASTYYWRVDEVNDVETPTTWPGDIWSLSTQEYLVAEDFESYNDIEVGKEGSHPVYKTWADGFGTTTNGSTVGYTEAFQPSMEKTLVYDGKQSVPLFYNNATAGFSEITANVADLQAGQDWAKYGIKRLTLYFYGEPNNAAQQMYMKLNDVKVLYDGEVDNITRKAWQPWNIDLKAFTGVNLSNVTKLAIGFERIAMAGGQGVVLLDGIRLYFDERQLITPVEPSPAGLVGHWNFDEGSGTVTRDSSGQGNDGTFQGSPRWVSGKTGGALQFDGDDDQIKLKSVFTTVGPSSNTVATWIKVPLAGTEGLGATERVGIVLGNYNSTPNTNWELAAAGQMRLYWNGGQVNQYGTSDLRDNMWHHIAWVRDKAANANYMYIDGMLEAAIPTLGTDITFNTTHCIGGDNRANPVNFHGLMDDTRIYDRALSQEEIVWLAGRTKPFDKPS